MVKLVNESYDVSGITINIAHADIRKRRREVLILQSKYDIIFSLIHFS